MTRPPDSIRPFTDLREEYWMIEKLGYGGFGKVYLIRHKVTRKHCAAKHLKIVDQQMQKVSRREAEILRILNSKDHNHVVQFVDYFEGAGQSVILIEYLPGGELFKRISSSNYELTETKCRNFARQILLGIQFIHSRGIIHLDLKPQNIIFVSNNDTNENNDSTSTSFDKIRREASSTRDHLKLIDFGLARRVEEQQIPINQCGTLEFMSPEVLRCVYAGRFSDMWSAGVIFFMMVSGGYSPFWAGDQYKTQRRILRGQYSFDTSVFQSVSKEAMNCISGLLTVSTSDRMTVEKCLEHVWMTGSYLDTLKVLETTWMRKYLARRRWQRWFNTVRAMNRLTLLLTDGKHDEEDIELEKIANDSTPSERWV